MFKNNKIKKYISYIATVAIILASLSVGWVAMGDDLVYINSANFPDKNFRDLVSAQYDRNGDGALSVTERTKESLPIAGYAEMLFGEDFVIEDLTGIEKFIGVQRLYIGGLGLKSLDVSTMTTLTQLTCEGNELTSLRLGGLQKLTKLNCESNELTALNVSGCSALVNLICDTNMIKNLDISSNSALQELQCQDNELTRLDVSSNTGLRTLYCARNHLTELDLRYNTKLSEVTTLMIGNQTTSAKANYSGKTIVVPFSLNRSNVVATSLDTLIDGGDSESSETKVELGYSATGNFVTKDVNNFKLDGHKNEAVKYEYNVNNPEVENMTVFIDITRDFSQVRFYTNDSMTELLSTQFVKKGGNAVAPSITDAPEDKIFGGWSSDYTNVTEDKDVYIRWINEHIWTVVKCKNNDVTIYCDDCGDEYSFKFTDVLNLTAEDIHFVPVLDVVEDGVLNAKDYAKLYAQLNMGE